MPLHIIKLCVGAESIQDILDWQSRHPPEAHSRHMPTRKAEILNGGSLYWVVKGLIQCRQTITGFRDGTDGAGKPMGYIQLDRAVIPTVPTPKRAFQGWRYLEAKDAPADLGAHSGGDLPDDMRAELMRLGVW